MSDRWYDIPTKAGTLEIGPVLREDFQAAEAGHLGDDLGYFLSLRDERGEREVLAKFVNEETAMRAVEALDARLVAISDD